MCGLEELLESFEVEIDRAEYWLELGRIRNMSTKRFFGPGRIIPTYFMKVRSLIYVESSKDFPMTSNIISESRTEQKWFFQYLPLCNP